MGSVLAFLAPGSAIRCRRRRAALWLALAVLTLGSACGAPRSDAADDEQLVSAFDAVLDRLHEQGLFDGAITVGRGEHLLYAGGRGLADRALALDFTVDTPIDGASLAKTFAAASIWELVAEGQLELETPVHEVVPEFSNHEVRLRHLLDHSAGLPELDDPSGMTNGDIAAAMPSQSDFVPGTRFRYCNECFDILALVVERVSGQVWDDFLDERFLTPLGMDHTFLRPPHLDDWLGPRARGYRHESDHFVLHDLFDDEPFYGSSNLVFSARDLDRWAAFLIGVARDQAHPWRAGFEQANFDGVPSHLNRLNWHGASQAGPFHFNGHLRGFHLELLWDPRTDTRLVWVSNVLGGRPVPQRLTRFLWELALDPTAVPPPTLFDSWLGSARPQDDEATVVGSYLLNSGRRIEIEFNGGSWSLSIDGAIYDLYPHRPFYAPALDVAIGFEDLEDGVYRTLLWEAVFEPGRGHRVAQQTTGR